MIRFTRQFKIFYKPARHSKNSQNKKTYENVSTKCFVKRYWCCW